MKETIITPKSPTLNTYIKTIYQSRYLIYTLTYRDIKIRYSQTILGWIWAVLQPIISVTIYTFFFSIIVKMDTAKIPYPLIALSGMVCWNYFSSIVNSGSSALIANQNLIKKLSFPKITLIISKALSGLVELSISFTLILISVIIFGIPISTKIFIIPLFFLVNFITGLSISIWIAALTIRNRDLLHIVPYIITLGIWLTPVFYPSTIIPEKLSFLLYFNPIAGVIEGVRYCLLDLKTFSFGYLLGFIFVFCLFLGGLIFFKNTEKSIPDYI
jgi:lipopolysaccharide transport system permease protein